MSSFMRLALGLVTSVLTATALVVGYHVWATGNNVIAVMLLLVALWTTEMASGLLAFRRVKTKTYCVPPPKESSPRAQRTLYLFVHGFMGNAKWPIYVFEKFGLHNKGWLVGVELDPRGGYDEYTLLEAIQMAVVDVERRVGAAVSIIVVADGEGVHTAVAWMRAFRYARSQKITEFVVNTAPDQSSSTTFNPKVLRILGAWYPGWMSRAAFWLWKKKQPVASGPALTPQQNAQNHAMFMKTSAIVAAGQANLLAKSCTFEGMLDSYICHMTYVAAYDSGDADHHVDTDQAIPAWRQAAPAGQFSVKTIAQWPARTHCNIGLYEPYVRFLATL